MNRLLLDTNAFLWWTADPGALSRVAHAAIADAQTEVWVSHATAWEMAIKAGTGKLRLPVPAGAFFTEHVSRNRFTGLPLTLRDVARVEHLPPHHRDPFDRVLVAQALERDLALVSSDALLREYGIELVW